MAARLSGHPRVRQKHPLRVRGQEHLERPLQAWIPLRWVPATRRQKHFAGKLSRQEEVGFSEKIDLLDHGALK